MTEKNNATYEFGGSQPLVAWPFSRARLWKSPSLEVRTDTVDVLHREEVLCIHETQV